MNPQPDTLHDRITDEQIVDLYWRTTGDDWAIPDRVMVAFARAVLAETTTAQPEADAVERAARGWHEAAEREAQDEGGAGMGLWESIDTDSRARALRYMRAALAAAGGGCACPWHEDGDESGGYGVYEQAHTSDCAAAAQPVEPEPDEREAHMFGVAGGCSCGWDSPKGTPFREHVQAWGDHRAGLRRSRPEATHTVTAEQRLTLARHMLAVRVGVPHVAFYEREGSQMWQEGIALADMALAALGVTVADTPTQGGDA